MGKQSKTAVVILKWANDRSYALHLDREAEDVPPVQVEIRKDLDPKEVAAILRTLADRFTREPGVKGSEAAYEAFWQKAVARATGRKARA